MATIFLKSVASGEKCVILEPREALLYTFDFGDWRELRMGFFVSQTQNGNDNQNYPGAFNDSITDNSPQGQLFIGFKDSSFRLPYNGETGVVFAGCTTIPGLLHSIQGNIDYFNFNGTAQLAVVSGVANNGIAYSGRTVYNGVTNANGPRTMITSAASAGLYAKFNCITLRRGSNYSGTGWLSTTQNSSPDELTTDYSVFSCRRLISTSLNTSFIQGQPMTGYFPNELNSAFIYSPYFSSRSRIHSLVVERYQ